MAAYAAFRSLMHVLHIRFGALFSLLCAVVVVSAERLEWARPKENLITTMRCHMVTDISLGDDIVVLTHLA